MNEENAALNFEVLPAEGSVFEDDIYPRTEFAEMLTKRMLHPRPAIDKMYQSGLFLSAPRRVGKTTFLRHDLIPSLQKEGALAIYVDLWSQANADPSYLVAEALKKITDELNTAGSRLLKGLKAVKNLGFGVGADGFHFDIGLKDVTPETIKDVNLSDAIIELRRQVNTDVVLVIDEVQHAIETPEGNNMLLALKAARDAVNTRQDATQNGHFFLVGTGSHRAKVQELVTRGNQAFKSAVSKNFPVLDEKFVRYAMSMIAQDGEMTPSLAAANKGFQILGNRPEDLYQALGELFDEGEHTPETVDDAFLQIVHRRYLEAVNESLARVAMLGDLAVEIFDYICQNSQPGDAESTKGLYTANTLTIYRQHLGGKTVSVADVQDTIQTMLDENLIARTSHGYYAISDPAARDMWLNQNGHGIFTGSQADDSDQNALGAWMPERPGHLREG